MDSQIDYLELLQNKTFNYMKIYKLYVDNMFRNPFRWGRCPMSIRHEYVFGIYLHFGEMMMTSFTKRWVITLYVGKWFYSVSNYTFIK